MSAETILYARECLEWWLRGMNQGGHLTTPQEIAEVYRVILERVEKEPRKGAKQ